MTPTRQKEFLVVHLFLATILFALPQMTCLVRNHGVYSPFTTGNLVSEQVFNEARLYAVGPRRWMSKGVLLDEMEVYESKKTASPYPILHSFLLGSLAYPFKNLEFIWNIAQIILPVLLWIALYRFFGFFSDNRWIRASLSWISVLFPFTPWEQIFKGGAALTQPLGTGSIPHPAMTLLILVMALGHAVRALTRSTWIPFVTAAFFGGLTYYTSYYAWVSYLFALFLMLAVSYRFRSAPTFQRLVFFTLTVMALGIPYLLYVANDHTALVSTLLPRIGYFHRTPDLYGLALLVIGATGLSFSNKMFISDPSKPRRQEAIWAIWMMLAMITACGIGFNLQIITGYDAQHAAGFLNRILFPVGTMFLGAVVVHFTRRYHFRTWYSFLFTLWVLPLIAMAGYVQYASASVTHRDHAASTSRRQLLDWVKKNIPTQDVIGTMDTELIQLLPAITANWNFLPAGDRTTLSDEEILKRYLLLGLLQQKTMDQLESDLGRPNGKLRLHAPYVFFSEPSLDARLRKIARDYYVSAKPAGEFANRRLDFFIVPTGTPVEHLEKIFLSAKVLFSNESWVVVRLDKVRPVAEPERTISSPGK